MPQAPQLTGARIEYGDAGVARGDPDAAQAVARERARVLQIGGIAQRGRSFELAGARTAEHDAAAVGRYPQAVVAGHQRGDPAVGQRLLIAAIVAQLAEFVAVETIEAVLGAEPHEAFGVLCDR